jgi:DNA-binding transcriptional ArsR family regulator
MLELDYSTIRHHLDVLQKHGILKKTGDNYGAVYSPTEGAARNWDLIEEIAEELPL